MRKFSLWMLVFALSVPGLHAQDAATQQQIDKLSGQLQDINDTEAAQGKQIEALEHDVADLRDKLNTPAVNNYASADDLQKLVGELKEIDRKRQEDRQLILDKIQDLAALSATPPPPAHHHAAPEPVDNSGGNDTSTDTATTTQQNGYNYKVHAGDSLSAIIKAFKEKGVKVTLSQVLKANPGLNPNTLYVGNTIFIPDASAK
jgi:LysM repeat protein